MAAAYSAMMRMIKHGPWWVSRSGWQSRLLAFRLNTDEVFGKSRMIK